jgi:hypothetical protein
VQYKICSSRRRRALDYKCGSIKELKGARTRKPLRKRKLGSSESYEVLGGTRLGC